MKKVINKKQKFILYGGGELGDTVSKRVIASGYEVTCFIDLKKEGYINNIPVYKMNENYIECLDKDDYIVIICLNNGTLHKEVADELFKHGFNYIVFLPMQHLIGTQDKVFLTSVFNQIVLEGEISGCSINSYDNYNEFVFDSDVSIIKYGAMDYIVWLPGEILFTENYNEWKGDKSKINYVNEGKEMNINCYYHKSLYSYLNGEKSDCKEYVEIYKIPYNSEKAVNKIKEREIVFKTFEKEWKTGLDFFIEGAPKAEWNKSGYFTLIGGHHRTGYLQFKGHCFFPIRLSKEEFSLWKNEDDLNRLINTIKENDISQLYVPIPHPAFLNYPSERESGYPKIMISILNFLGNDWLTGKNILDIGHYQGYFARITSRLHAGEVVYFEENQKELNFVILVFKLLHIDRMIKTEYDRLRVREANHWDMIFAMENIHALIDSGYLNGYKGILFAEFKANIAGVQKKIMNQTGLNRYFRLCNEILNGEKHEIGVFYAEEKNEGKHY